MTPSRNIDPAQPAQKNPPAAGWRSVEHERVRAGLPGGELDWPGPIDFDTAAAERLLVRANQLEAGANEKPSRLQVIFSRTRSPAWA